MVYNEGAKKLTSRRSRRQLRIPEGHQRLWTTMAAADGINVLYGVSILSIDRQLSDPDLPVRIQYTQKSRPEEVMEKEYDFLIYLAARVHARKYVKDLVSEEASIFSKLQSFVLATALYTSDPVLDYTDERQAPIMYRTDKMFDPSQDGSWYTDRYGAAIFAGEWAKLRQTRVGYQFYENYCEADPVLCDSDRTPDQNNRMYQSEELLAKFREELKEMRVKNRPSWREPHGVSSRCRVRARRGGLAPAPALSRCMM